MGVNLYISNFNMKKNILNTVLIITVLIVTDFTIGVIFGFLQDTAVKKSPGVFPTEYVYNEVNSDIVIIGSSRANHHYVSSIIEDSLNLSVYNCGNDGCFLYYQTCMIDALLRRYSPKMIIWELYSPDLLSEPLNLESEYQRFYLLHSLCNSNEFTDSMLHVKDKYEYLKLQSAAYRYNSELIKLVNILISPAVNNNDKGYIPIPNDGYKFPSVAEFITTTSNKKIYSQVYSLDRERLFIETVNKCLKQNVQIIFAFSPWLERSDYKSTDSYKSILKISNENNIRLIDDYHNETYMGDSTLFKDNTHLNDKGARKYTKKIASELKEYLNL